MNPQTTLDIVRELSERATLRPAPTHLHLVRPADLQAARRRIIIPYEELHPARIGGAPGRASGQKSRKRTPEAAAAEPASERDFLSIAAEKAEAAIERRVVVIPAGQ